MDYMQLFDLGPSGDQDDATIVIPAGYYSVGQKIENQTHRENVNV